MGEKKLRIGLIGCGGITRQGHMPAYLCMREDVEVVAFCDIQLERAQYFAAKNGSGMVTEDYRQVIARTEVDAVDICLPNYLHAPVARAALLAGKHVLCEKPDATDIAGVEAMRDAAESVKRVLMVIRNNRFMPASVYAKRLLERGEAGEIYAGHCGWQRRRGIPGKGGWFTTKEKSGGGSLIDLGVHMIDLALYLMGNPKPVSVTGATYAKFVNSGLIDSENAAFGDAKEAGVFDVEDLAMGFIRFENGACLTVDCSWASNIERENRFVTLYGDQTGLSWQDGSLAIYGEDAGRLTNLTPRLPNGRSGLLRQRLCMHSRRLAPRLLREMSSHEANIRHFVRVARGHEAPIYTPEQGVDMIKILTALYASAETGKEIIL